MRYVWHRERLKVSRISSQIESRTDGVVRSVALHFAISIIIGSRISRNARYHSGPLLEINMIPGYAGIGLLAITNGHELQRVLYMGCDTSIVESENV